MIYLSSFYHPKATPLNPTVASPTLMLRSSTYPTLSNEIMKHRIRDRRRDLMIKDSRCYENVKDVEWDIQKARKEWMREILGTSTVTRRRRGLRERVEDPVF